MARSDDGGIWRLTWKLVNGEYRGHVVGHPRIRASGSTFEEMDQRLCHQVSRELQAGEWTADWSPPPPRAKSSAGAILDSHVALSGEGRFVALQDPNDVFTAYCNACGMVTGIRTERPLRVVVETPGNLCGDFGSLPNRLTIFSRELADAISNIAPPALTVNFRDVERLGRGSKDFVEPIPVDLERLAPTVALLNMKQGWSCTLCGFQFLYQRGPDNPSSTYHRLADLPPSECVFWLRNIYGQPEVCVPVAWWRKNRRAKFASGVTSRAVAVATDEEIDSPPKPEPRSEPVRGGSFRAKWFHTQMHLAKTLRVPFTPWKP